MLKIILPATDEFKEVELEMEHSLVSLREWEAFYEKPFFNQDGMNEEESLTYFGLMILSPEVPPNFGKRLEAEHYKKINEYINANHTATTFHETGSSRRSNEVVTAELIYYWMIGFQIPFETQTWHLNNLMTLIRVAGLKQTKPKRMGKAEQAEQMRRLNAQRREQLGTQG